MTFNIVDLVKDQISDQLLGQMGSVLGTDGSKTSAALGGALPGLLAGLAGTAERPEGAGALFDAARHQDESLLGDMGNLLDGGDETSRIIEQGTSTLGSLLGVGAVGKLGGVLANFAGISRSGSGSLIGMLAPIVIGAIKRKMSEGDLDAGGLASLLGEQRSNIDAAMPQGLSGQLQSEGFFDSIAPESPAPRSVTEPVSPTAAPVADVAPASAPTQASSVGVVEGAPVANRAPAAEPASSGGGMPGWLLPVAAVVVLGVLAWLFLGGDADEAGTVPDTVATDTAAAVQEEMVLPEGVTIERVNGELSEVFDKVASTLGSIDDEASARATLPDLKDANTTLGGLNDLILRLPEGARAPIGAAVTAGLVKLQPLADKVLALPAAGPVIEPVLAPMLAKMQSLAR